MSDDETLSPRRTPIPSDMNSIIREMVTSNPVTCRALLEQIRKRGVKFRDSLDGLTPDELKLVAMGILEELEKREAN